MNLSLRFFKLIIVISLAIIANACVIKQQVNHDQDPAILWQQHQHDLTAINAFQLTGSLAYFSEKSRYYGRFYINQRALNEYQIKLTSPVGSSIFSLDVTPFFAELTDSEGRKYRDENVEQLVEHLTSMKIPLKALSRWLIGFSDNDIEDNYDTSGRLLKTKLSQQNQTWNMVISKYTSVKLINKSIDLPATIELINQDDKLRLTITNWILN